MQIETFKVFCDVVDTASFSEAGRLNGISQSAVSQQLSSLENSLGVRLLERGRKVFAVTPEGQEFEKVAREICAAYSRLETAVAPGQHSLCGRVGIAAQPDIALSTLSGQIGDFAEKEPEVELGYQFGEPADVAGAVLSGAADIGFADHVSAHRSLSAQQIADEELVIVSTVGSPAPKRGKDGIKQFAGAVVAAPPYGTGTRRVLDAELRSKALRPARIIETDSVATALRLVELGGCISLLPSTSAAAAESGGGIVTSRLRGGKLIRPIYLIQKRHRSDPAPVEGLVRFLAESAGT